MNGCFEGVAKNRDKKGMPGFWFSVPRNARNPLPAEPKWDMIRPRPLRPLVNGRVVVNDHLTRETERGFLD